MASFFVGLDLGQSHDNTAVALLVRQIDHGRARYALRHLRRWPPGSAYPRIAEDVSRMLLAVPPCGRRLVVDQTAVGRAVATVFRHNNGVSTRHVLISAGHAISSGDDGCTHVPKAPKKELVSVLQMLFRVTNPRPQQFMQKDGARPSRGIEPRYRPRLWGCWRR
jgi:hypothetical protein